MSMALPPLILPNQITPAWSGSPGELGVISIQQPNFYLRRFAGPGLSTIRFIVKTLSP